MSSVQSTYLHRQIIRAISQCSDPTDLKVVIAPENHAALSLRTALARQGMPLVNIEAVTPSGLARHIWRAVFPEDGFRFLNRTAAEFVLGVLVEDLDESVASLLRSSISTVYDSIQSDRVATLTAVQLKLEATNTVQESYADLYERYASYLADHGRLDEIDIQRLARQAVGQFASQRHVGLVVMSDMVELTDAELSLVSDLGVLSEHHFLFGSALRKGEGLPDWPYPMPFEPGEKINQARVLIRSTRREEVRSVVADIVDQEVAFDEVEIALADENAYLGEVASACERFGIPWQTSARSSDTDPRLVALVRSHAEWVLSGHSVEGLSRMVRNRLLDVSGLEKHAGDIASAMDAFPASMGNLRNPEVRAVMAEKAGSRGVSKSQLIALHAFIDKITPFVMPSYLTLSSYSAVFFGLFEAFSTHIAPKGAIEEYWGKQFSFANDSGLPSAKASWIAKRIGQSLTGLSSRHRKGLMVLPLKDAGYGWARRVYVLGLDDQASADAASNRTPVASIIPSADAESQPLRHFPVSNRLLTRELFRRYGSDLVLCAPSYDVGSGRTLFPGSTLIDLLGLESLRPEVRTRWLDRADFLAGTRDARVLEDFDSLRYGNEAQFHRSSDKWTEFDGVLAVPPDWRMATSSPSRLETLATCPYRFFLMHVLKLTIPLEKSQEWMTKREEGEVLHALFEAHIRERMGEEDLLLKLSQALKRAALLSDGGSDALLDRKTKSMGVSVALYLKREKDNAGKREPVAVEFSFGSHPNNDIPPCVIPLSHGPLSLSGRLDRMDRTKEGTYVITDFKTGSFKDFAPQDLQKLTDKLQWAIYALAVSSGLNVTVESFEYFFPSEQGAGLVRQVAGPSTEQVLPILEDLSLRFNQGAFVQAAKPGAGACTYCEFQDVCGDLAQRRIELTSKFLSQEDDLSPVFQNWPYRNSMKGDS